MSWKKRNDLEDLFGSPLLSESRPRVVRETVKMVLNRDGYRHTVLIIKELIPKDPSSTEKYLRRLGVEEELIDKVKEKLEKGLNGTSKMGRHRLDELIDHT